MDPDFESDVIIRPIDLGEEEVILREEKQGCCSGTYSVFAADSQWGDQSGKRVMMGAVRHLGHGNWIVVLSHRPEPECRKMWNKALYVRGTSASNAVTEVVTAYRQSTAKRKIEFDNIGVTDPGEPRRITYYGRSSGGENIVMWVVGDDEYKVTLGDRDNVIGWIKAYGGGLGFMFKPFATPGEENHWNKVPSTWAPTLDNALHFLIHGVPYKGDRVGPENTAYGIGRGFGEAPTGVRIPDDLKVKSGFVVGGERAKRERDVGPEIPKAHSNLPSWKRVVAKAWPGPVKIVPIYQLGLYSRMEVIECDVHECVQFPSQVTDRGVIYPVRPGTPFPDAGEILRGYVEEGYRTLVLTSDRRSDKDGFDNPGIRDRVTRDMMHQGAPIWAIRFADEVVVGDDGSITVHGDVYMPPFRLIMRSLSAYAARRVSEHLERKQDGTRV